MSARCFVCGGKKTASIHSRVHPNSHTYQDSSQGGLQGVSAGRRAYQQSEAHKTAYKDVTLESVCVFAAAGAPDPCRYGITPHHTFPKGRSGSEERSERVAPVVPACGFHNTWVSQDPEGIAFGETHWITVGGRDWPLLLSDADARELEALGREFKPASNPSLATSKES